MIRRPPRSTLFPYDALPISRTLCRSRRSAYRCGKDTGRRLALPVRGTPSTVRRRRVASPERREPRWIDRKSTRLNSSHTVISYAVFCLKKKKERKKKNEIQQ